MFRRRHMLIAISVICVAACSRGYESCFTLAPDSRLPKWIPRERARSEVSVVMCYYTPHDGRTASFRVFDSGGRLLSDQTGKLRGLEPQTLDAAKSGDGLVYPAYEVIDVDGVIDVIEHRRMDATFYASDDAKAWQALGVSGP